MNKILIVIVVVLLLGGAGWFLMSKDSKTTGTTTKQVTTGSKTNTGATVTTQNVVELKDFDFSPKSLTVKAGSTVTFKNTDLAGHSVTAEDKSFDSGILNQNETASITFDKAGTYPFYCTSHPAMKMTVTVQ
jgi:plastocyanin